MRTFIDLLSCIHSSSFLRPDSHPGTLRIHLRSLSTGQPHPLAQEETLNFPISTTMVAEDSEEGSEPVWYAVQAYEGHIAVMFQMVESLAVAPYMQFTSKVGFWDWKSGAMKTVGEVYAYRWVLFILFIHRWYKVQFKHSVSCRDIKFCWACLVHICRTAKKLQV